MCGMTALFFYRSGIFILDAVHIELEHFAAIGAFDFAEREDVLIDGNGFFAGRAGHLIENRIAVMMTAAAAVVMVVVVTAAAIIVLTTAAALVVVFIVIIVIVINYFLDVGEVVGDGVNFIGEVERVVFEIFNILRNGFENFNDGGKKLVLLVILIKTQTVCKTLEVCYFFGCCHFIPSYGIRVKHRTLVLQCARYFNGLFLLF